MPATEDIEPIPLVPATLDVPTLNGDLTDAAVDGITPDIIARVEAQTRIAAQLVQQEREWSGWNDIVLQTLQHHQDAGDIQTCVYVALVFHNLIQIPKRQALGWFTTYIGTIIEKTIVFANFLFHPANT